MTHFCSHCNICKFPMFYRRMDMIYDLTYEIFDLVSELKEYRDQIRNIKGINEEEIQLLREIKNKVDLFNNKNEILKILISNQN